MYQFACIFFLTCNSLLAFSQGVHVGNVFLRTQNQVDSLAAAHGGDLEVIDGALVIGALDPRGVFLNVTDLRPLSSLRHVNALYIRSNPQLEVLTGLDSLVFAGYTEIGYNDVLRDISALRTTQIYSGVAIGYNPKLEGVVLDSLFGDADSAFLGDMPLCDTVGLRGGSVDFFTMDSVGVKHIGPGDLPLSFALSSQMYFYNAFQLESFDLGNGPGTISGVNIYGAIKLKTIGECAALFINDQSGIGFSAFDERIGRPDSAAIGNIYLKDIDVLFNATNINKNFYIQLQGFDAIDTLLFNRDDLNNPANLSIGLIDMKSLSMVSLPNERNFSLNLSKLQKLQMVEGWNRLSGRLRLNLRSLEKDIEVGPWNSDLSIAELSLIELTEIDTIQNFPDVTYGKVKNSISCLNLKILPQFPENAYYWGSIEQMNSSYPQNITILDNPRLSSMFQGFQIDTAGIVLLGFTATSNNGQIQVRPEQPVSFDGFRHLSYFQKLDIGFSGEIEIPPFDSLKQFTYQFNGRDNFENLTFSFTDDTRRIGDQSALFPALEKATVFDFFGSTPPNGSNVLINRSFNQHGTGTPFEIAAPKLDTFLGNGGIRADGLRSADTVFTINRSERRPITVLPGRFQSEQLNMATFNSPDATRLTDELIPYFSAAERFYLGRNPKLEDCTLLCDLVNAGVIEQGELTIELNNMGCNSLAEIFEACNALPVDDQPASSQAGFKIYPNPASEYFTLTPSEATNTSSLGSSYTISSITGQQVMTIRPRGKDSFTVNISSLSAGMYIVAENVEGIKRPGKLLVVR